MARLLTSSLIELCGKYKLSLDNIETWKPRDSIKSSSSGYWKKIGFEFTFFCPLTKVNNKIYFYGKLSDYNNIDIEKILIDALDKFNSSFFLSSKYYYICKEKELFVENKNDAFFNSDFYIQNLKKYL